MKVLENAAKMAGKKPINALLIQCAASELKPAAVSKLKKAAYPAPATYTTNLKVFLEWLASLENHVRQNKTVEILRHITKAQSNQGIVPEMPEMVRFADPHSTYGWLSMMSAHAVEYKKQAYRTAEALFQCLRFEGHPDIQKIIMAQQSPIGVKMAAKKYSDRLEGFEPEANLKLMRICLNLKLEQHEDLKKQLLATGEKLIVEDCTTRARGDALFWGMALINRQWVGENSLGRLWMELRGKS